MLMTEQAETAQTAMQEKVEAALAQVRPMLQRDGGDVELAEITDDGIVKVRLQGACQGCPMAQMTLQMGIESAQGDGPRHQVGESRGVALQNSNARLSRRRAERPAVVVDFVPQALRRACMGP